MPATTNVTAEIEQLGEDLLFAQAAGDVAEERRIRRRIDLLTLSRAHRRREEG